MIIENQFGPTNHDHLGKILTYAAGLDAEAIIWVAEKLREEHRQALEWLNRHTDKEIGFFGVVVEVLRIEASPPAVNFKPVVFPNEWQRAVRQPPDASSGRSEAYRTYFQALLDELREKHRFTNARIGQPQNWYTFRSGVPGPDYGTSFAQGGRVRVELYIDFEDSEINKKSSLLTEAGVRECLWRGIVMGAARRTKSEQGCCVLPRFDRCQPRRIESDSRMGNR